MNVPIWEAGNSFQTTGCAKPGYDAEWPTDCRRFPIMHSTRSDTWKTTMSSTAHAKKNTSQNSHIDTALKHTLTNFKKDTNRPIISAEELLINSIKELEIKEKSVGMSQEFKMLRCSTCNVDLNSISQAKAHLSGTKHLKMSKNVNPMKRKMLETPDSLHCGKSGRASYFCAFCEVELNSAVQADAHFTSLKHQKKLQNEEKLSLSDLQPSTAVSNLRCHICDISFTSEVHALMHYEGKKHASKAKSLHCPEPVSPEMSMQASNFSFKDGNEEGSQTFQQADDAVGIRTFLLGERNDQQQSSMDLSACNKRPLECLVCRISVNSESQLKAHHISKKHMQAVDQITKRGCGRGRGYMLNHFKQLLTTSRQKSLSHLVKTPFPPGTNRQTSCPSLENLASCLSLENRASFVADIPDESSRAMQRSVSWNNSPSEQQGSSSCPNTSPFVFRPSGLNYPAS